MFQKYCERPLLVSGRKFDLRLWVLVTDWNPLSVWVYDDCLVRFCAADFDLWDIGSAAKHLTNVSLCKDGSEARVWDAAQLEEYLYEITGDAGCWRDALLPRVRQIIVDALRCARGDVCARKDSFELYGFDLMVDDTVTPWLLEANLSPDMRHTTSVKSRIVPRMVSHLPLEDHGLLRQF